MIERHDEQLIGFATLNKIFPIIDTVDNLDSDVSVKPLAARQGKVLREMIETIKTIKINIVEELPQTGSNDIIYFILNSSDIFCAILSIINPFFKIQILNFSKPINLILYNKYFINWLLNYIYKTKKNQVSKGNKLI